MRRDWDLCRQILLRVEEGRPTSDLGGRFGSAERARLEYHERILHDGGMLTRGTSHEDGVTEIDLLTFEGCELLDKIRSDRVWSDMKHEAAIFDVGLTVELIGFLSRKMVTR